jgi:hypothetical protein
MFEVHSALNEVAELSVTKGLCETCVMIELCLIRAPLSLSTPRIFILTDFQPDFRQASLEGAH